MVPLVLCVLAAQCGPEIAGGKRFQGAEPGGELYGGQAAGAVEGAKKILCRGFAFLGVALHATRNEVAVGIAPHAGKGHDMVEAARAGGEPAQTIEAEAAVARVNGGAPRLRLQEIHLLDVGGALLTGQAGAGNFSRLWGANLAGQADLDHVTRSGAFDQAQSALGNEAAHGLARGGRRKTGTAHKPKNRKAEPELSFEPAMPQEMRIDDSFDDSKAQPRHENIFELFPDEDGVDVADFHGCDPDVAETRFRLFAFERVARSAGL